MIENIDLVNYFSRFNTDTFKNMSIGSNGPLVESQSYGYNFDQISYDILSGNKLKSVDSIAIRNGIIYFIEFKTGFKKKISTSNFDKSKWPCPSNDNKFCEEGAKYFLENQKLTAIEMNQSIQMKLVESFCVFEKFIIPECEESSDSYKVKFIAVIDAVNEIPLEMYENALNSLAKLNNEDNVLDSLRKSLRKYIIKDKYNKSVFYDEVDVYTKQQFDQLFSA